MLKRQLIESYNYKNFKIFIEHHVLIRLKERSNLDKKTLISKLESYLDKIEHSGTYILIFKKSKIKIVTKVKIKEDKSKINLVTILSFKMGIKNYDYTIELNESIKELFDIYNIKELNLNECIMVDNLVFMNDENKLTIDNIFIKEL